MGSTDFPWTLPDLGLFVVLVLIALGAGLLMGYGIGRGRGYVEDQAALLADAERLTDVVDPPVPGTVAERDLQWQRALALPASYGPAKARAVVILRIDLARGDAYGD